MNPSIRAQVITQRTYSQSKEINPHIAGDFETWEETIDRVIAHQRWLWERAQGRKLERTQTWELKKLKDLFIKREALPSGRTLWLGGTALSKEREATQFNCYFRRVETIHDVVDCYWLLLQGCGVGFEPVVGCLNGFSKPMQLEIIRSRKTLADGKGNPHNVEWERDDTWHITVGDSAEAWAKFPGKLLAQKKVFKKLVVDFSEVRAAGYRLSRYGWISSGDSKIAKATEAIVKLLNIRNNNLLTRIDILDIMNLLGDTLSSRRSAEICVVPYGDPEWVPFAKAKADLSATPWRVQSNNTVLFYHKPSRAQLEEFFELLRLGGGSEPGIANASHALKRAPWFKGFNPCAEILLPNGGFCQVAA